MKPITLKIIKGITLASFLLFVGLLTVIFWLNQPQNTDVFVSEEVNPLIFSETMLTEPSVPSSTSLLSYKVPTSIKAVYVTSNTALGSSVMNYLKELIDTTELNAVVIDVNDSSRNILDNPKFKNLIMYLNSENIHTIARIITFQNAKLADARPELSLRTLNGNQWYDSGGQRWVDPASRAVWQEIEILSERVATLGFREINYDYIRFPSDGPLHRIVYPYFDETTSKSGIINSFADFIVDQRNQKYPEVILSANIFPHTIFVDDDAGIGQNFLSLASKFDVLSPMIYPSHYRAGNFGYQNPGANPYGVVKGTLDIARKKLKTAGVDGVIVRPWLQDFSLGVYYSTDLVKKQMTAVVDAGFSNGWMLWNPHNRYSVKALSPVSRSTEYQLSATILEASLLY